MSKAAINATPDAMAQQRVDDYHHRQQSVARVLDELFSKPAKNKPELWDQRAYLMVMGMIYERLATGEAEISTEELTAMAKILAEQRKARPARPGRKAGTKPVRAGSAGDLPKMFGEMVDQVYGTSGASDDALSKKEPCVN